MKMGLRIHPLFPLLVLLASAGLIVSRVWLMPNIPHLFGMVPPILLATLSILQLFSYHAVISDQEIQRRNLFGVVLKRFSIQGLASLKVEGRKLMVQTPQGWVATGITQGNTHPADWRRLDTQIQYAQIGSNPE